MGSDNNANNRIRDGVFHRGPCPRKVGTNWLLWGRVDTSFPFQGMVGPDWPCMIATYSLIVGGGYSIINYVIPETSLGDVGKFTVVGLVIATVCSFTFAGCSEPGIVFVELGDEEEAEQGDALVAGAEEGKSKEKPKQQNRCRHCDVVRGSNASHCYDCNLCINGLDHHCPWTGKCIGKKNLIPFYVFLGCLSGLLIFSALAAVLMVVKLY